MEIGASNIIFSYNHLCSSCGLEPFKLLVMLGIGLGIGNNRTSNINVFSIG